MPQYSIPDAPSAAYRGMIAEAGAPRYVRSKRAEGADCSAGLLMKRGTDKEHQVSPLTTGDTVNASTFAGVLVLDTGRPYSDDGIEAGDPVEVMRFGVAVCEYGEAVTDGEIVAIDLATGLLYGYPEGTAAGAITTGRVVVPGLRVAQTITAAGLARTEVNLVALQTAATIGSL